MAERENDPIDDMLFGDTDESADTAEDAMVWMRQRKSEWQSLYADVFTFPEFIMFARLCNIYNVMCDIRAHFTEDDDD